MGHGIAGHVILTVIVIAVVIGGVGIGWIAEEIGSSRRARRDIDARESRIDRRRD